MRLNRTVQATDVCMEITACISHGCPCWIHMPFVACAVTAVHLVSTCRCMGSTHRQGYWSDYSFRCGLSFSIAPAIPEINDQHAVAVAVCCRPHGIDTSSPRLQSLTLANLFTAGETASELELRRREQDINVEDFGILYHFDHRFTRYDL
jgi:hypothetical protein